jgi:RIP metalloprotease RseP
MVPSLYCSGYPVLLSDGPPMKAAQKQVGDLISRIRDTPDGETLTLSVKRENKALDVSIRPQRTTDNDQLQSIGVFLSPNLKEVIKLQSDNVVEAFQLAWQYFNNILSQTLDGFVSLISTLLMGKSLPPGQSVSGPIGLIKTGTKVVATKDLTTVLLFAAALLVNLGVINALPLPALDGGQLVFVLAEALTGRKVDQRLQEGISSVAVLLLLLVSILTAFSDVGSIISGR